MVTVNLSTLAIIVGLIYVVLNGYGVLKPAEFASALRKFPRYTPLGYPLIIAPTAGFMYYVNLESVSDFAAFKPVLFVLFAAVCIGTCLFVRDYLPVRGLAVLLLVAAKLIVDSARWLDTPWRLVMILLAYGWVIAGMWFTIAPWRLRDLIQWATASHDRLRLLSALRLGIGLFVILLGLTVYRSHPAARSQFQAVVEDGHVTFPLTPTLSLREREHGTPPLDPSNSPGLSDAQQRTPTLSMRSIREKEQPTPPLDQSSRPGLSAQQRLTLLTRAIRESTFQTSFFGQCRGRGLTDPQRRCVLLV